MKAWRCVVCGYIHRGAEPPAQCPVCGFPAEHFEAYEEAVKIASGQKTKRWRCLVCNYEQEGETAPDFCPVCGVPATNFEAVEPQAEALKGSNGQAEDIVIVGAGIAGISAAEAIRQHAPDTRVTMISKETYLPYYRINLTRFLAGETTEDTLPIHQENWYKENHVNLISGVDVTGIKPDTKSVTLADGRSIRYEKLVLTTGAHPYIPPLPGASLAGVTTLRSMADAHEILEQTKKVNHIVIIGGGILGLEAAGAMAKKGKKTVLIENYKWLMPRQLNQTAAELLEKHVENLGISLRFNARVTELVGEQQVTDVRLANGETLPADLVILTAGIRSNSDLGRLAGLQVNTGIIVNDYMETSIPGIYAAGDIAEHRGIVYGLWNAAQYQGHIAGQNAAGQMAEFGGIPRSHSLKVLGVDLLSIGKFSAEDDNDIIIESKHAGNYYCFVFHDSLLVGSILYGNTRISNGVKRAIEKREDCSALLNKQPTGTEVWNYFLNK